jgi:hypothetical protein
MFRRNAALYLFAFLALFSACAPATQNSNQAPAVPADLLIVFGSGGGVTGMWEGHTIQPDGAVLAWNGRVAEENPRPAGMLSAEQRTTLWKKINEIGFFDLKEDERGNMTSLFRVTANSRTHEVYWVPRLGGPVAASPLQQLYTLGQETVSHAAGPDR